METQTRMTQPILISLRIQMCSVLGSLFLGGYPAQMIPRHMISFQNWTHNEYMVNIASVTSSVTPMYGDQGLCDLLCRTRRTSAKTKSLSCISVPIAQFPNRFSTTEIIIAVWPQFAAVSTSTRPSTLMASNLQRYVFSNTKPMA